VAVAISLFVAVSSVLFSPGPTNQASAAANDGFGAYFSPPFVQGPAASANAVVQTFNDQAAGTCNMSTINATSVVGTFSLIGNTTGQTHPCKIIDGATDVWGGANTTTDTPTVNTAGTKYLKAPDCVGTPCSQSLQLDLPAGVKYVGFWWSAGNAGNRVRFYTAADPVNPIATYTTNTLNTTLGTSNPSPYPGTAKVTAIDGTEFLRARYFGRPANVPSVTTSSISGLTNKEGHAFISLYTAGNVEFSKIDFNGPGFEMDNIAISTNPGPVANNLVFLEGVLGTAVEFKANGGTGAMPAQISTSAAPLVTNAFTKQGYDFDEWNTASDGSGGTSYVNNDNYAFAASTSLYAQWVAATLNVAYDEQGGSSIPDSTFLNGSAITLPAAPTKAGQQFDGWFTSTTGGTALGATYTPTSNASVTLYARWSAAAVTTTTTSTTTTTVATAATTTTTVPQSVTTTTQAPVSVTTTTLNLQNAPAPSLKKTSASSDNLPVTGNSSLHLLLTALCMLMIGTALTTFGKKIRT
jgi:uncharacterized repeat protein (TIGR02543 family)